MDEWAGHWTMDPRDKAAGLLRLTDLIPALAEDQRWLASMPMFITSEAYQLIELRDRDGDGDLAALCLATVYEQPLVKSHLIVVEALWLASDNSALHWPLWATLIEKAHLMRFEGVCITLNAPGAQALADAGIIDGHPVFVEAVPMQHAVEGLFTAFGDRPTSGALSPSLCVYICNRDRLDSFAGVVNEGDAAFFRGEGRLQLQPHWNCPDLPALAAYFIERGFPTRGEGVFDGSVMSQLCQQGYVDQGTASMSRSFAVAANYATHGGQREGVVFRIDGASVRRQGPVFDAYATLLRHSELMFKPDDMATFGRVVRALGPLVAGRQLQRWSEVAHGFAGQHGGLARAHESFTLEDYLDPVTVRQLASSGVESDTLTRLLRALEAYAMTAVSPMSSVVTAKVMGDGSIREAPLRKGYPIAFQLIRSQLEAALADRDEDYRQVGWDLTPFGYMAKTCRDEEVFSFGAIPGAAVAEAIQVDRRGVAGKTLARR